MSSLRLILESALAPRRTQILPMLMVLAPLLWFVYRSATGPGSTGAIDVAPVTLGWAVSRSIVVSYILGAAIAAVLTDDINPRRPLVGKVAHPTTGMVVLVTMIAVAVVSYLVAIQFFEIPYWANRVFEPLGLLLAVPLAIVYAGTIAVGNVLAVDTVALEAIAVAIGISSSVLWVFLLAIGVDALMDTIRTSGDRW